MHIISPSSRHMFSSCAVLEQCRTIANTLGRYTDFKVAVTYLSHGTETGPTASDVTKHRVFIFHWLFVLYTDTFAPQKPALFVEWTGLWFIWNLFHLYFFPSHSVSAHVQLAGSDQSQPTAASVQLWIWLKFDMRKRDFALFSVLARQCSCVHPYSACSV